MARQFLEIEEEKDHSSIRYAECIVSALPPGMNPAPPPAWAMAPFIPLAASLKIGCDIETRQVVYDR
jgi:hypothetical protein